MPSEGESSKHSPSHETRGRARQIVHSASLIALGGALALNLRPYLPSTAPGVVIGGFGFSSLIAQDQNHTAVGAIDIRAEHTEEDEHAANCRAVLAKCRPKTRRQRRRLQAVNGALTKGKLGRNKVITIGAQPATSSSDYQRPNCKHKGPYAHGLSPCYTTKALESEMHFVDRLIVHSTAFLSSFDGSRMAEFMPKNQDIDDKAKKPITIVILTVNRHVNYLSVVLTTLLQGHRPSYLRDNVDIHVANIEMRPCRCAYSLFSELKARLPFVTFHDWSVQYSPFDNITDADVPTAFMIRQRRAFINSLEICMDAESDWCFIWEDDVALTANLIPKFFNILGEMNPDDKQDLAIISFYYPLNEMWMRKNNAQLYKPEYVESERYRADSSASQYIDSETGRIKYELNPNDVPHGTVANAYPSTVLVDLIDYLEDRKNSTYATDRWVMNHFPEDTNRRKWRVEPSMAKHIGHYSESRKGSQSGAFYWLSTDVRFQLYDGWDADENNLHNVILDKETGHYFN